MPTCPYLWGSITRSCAAVGAENSSRPLMA
jgi:hypothetical protein